MAKGYGLLETGGGGKGGDYHQGEEGTIRMEKKKTRLTEVGPHRKTNPPRNNLF